MSILLLPVWQLPVRIIFCWTSSMKKKVMDFSEKYTASGFFCIKFVGGWYFSLCHTNKSCIYCHADGDSARKQYCESMIFEHQTLWVDSLDVLVIYGLPSVIQELSSFFAGETTTCTNVNGIWCDRVLAHSNHLFSSTFSDMSCWHSYRIDWWKNFSHTYYYQQCWGCTETVFSRLWFFFRNPVEERTNSLKSILFVQCLLFY